MYELTSAEVQEYVELQSYLREPCFFIEAFYCITEDYRSLACAWNPLYPSFNNWKSDNSFDVKKLLIGFLVLPY